MEAPLHNGRDHRSKPIHYLLVGIIGLASILALASFFVGDQITGLRMTTVVVWSVAFVAFLIIDQHNSWIVALGFFATGVFTGLMTFVDIPTAIEFVVLSFIGAVLIALSINRLFGTFDLIGYYLIVLAKNFRELLIFSGILAGVQAFLFDEGSSVGSMAMILGPIFAGIMVQIGKHHDPDSVDPEEQFMAGRVFNLGAKNFVIFTNLLAFVLAIGHPVSLSIARYAGWDLGFWFIYVAPISLVCYFVGRFIFFRMHGREVDEYDTYYQGYRRYKLEKGFEVTRNHKIGLAYLLTMGFLQVTHQGLADLLGQPHEVTLILFPIIMSVIMGCHVYLLDRHKLHDVLGGLPIGEFLNMAGIFTMAYLLSVVGVLGWIARQITGLALALGGIVVLGGMAAILSALLENLGVAIAINTVVDQIYGGMINTTPVRLSVMIQSMLAGNVFVFASVAGLVGLPLLQTYITVKLRAYADQNEKWHVYDPFIVRIQEGISWKRWLPTSLPIAITTIVVSMLIITAVDQTFGYPEGVYYCEYTDAIGCLEETPGHGHGNEPEIDHPETDPHALETEPQSLAEFFDELYGKLLDGTRMT